MTEEAPVGAPQQLLLQDEDYAYDVVNNPVEIRDWRIPEEWPAGAKPVTRKIQYDDLYRVSRVDQEYSDGDDQWISPSGVSEPSGAEASQTRHVRDHSGSPLFGGRGSLGSGGVGPTRHASQLRFRLAARRA
jgi:hypothetical protein